MIQKDDQGFNVFQFLNEFQKILINLKDLAINRRSANFCDKKHRELLYAGLYWRALLRPLYRFPRFSSVRNSSVIGSISICLSLKVAVMGN